MAIRRIENGVEGPWEVFKIKGEKGDTGLGLYKSIVFVRSSAAPSPLAPTGGSYASPIPTSTVTDLDGTYNWSDGVPPGEKQLWSSSRIFSEDPALEDDFWSDAITMTNTEKVEYLYSTVINNPSDPNIDQTDWTSDPTVNAVWMAIRRIIDGVPQNWNVYKIKGEGGFKSIVFKRSETQPSTPLDGEGSYANPVPTGWNDGVPSGTLQLWTTSRFFTEAGGVGSWKEPSSMTDTALIDFLYNDSPSQPVFPPTEDGVGG